MIFGKRTKAIKWSKDSLFNKWWQENWTSTCENKNENLDSEFTPFTKINSKWITHLNIKHKTIKLLKDNIEENLNDIGYGDDVLDMTSKAQSIREIINELETELP